jgi:hypothetical protein
MGDRKMFEEFDEIMEEMESKTPRNSANLSFDLPQANSTRISDDVDARPTSSQPQKPLQSNLFRTLFRREESTKKPGQIYPSRPTNERYYDYTHSNLGIAIIFNQVKFKEETERKGSSKDAQDLRNVLSDLGFEVEVLQDYTTAQIKEFLYRRE